MLDVTRPVAAEHPAAIVRRLRTLGIDYFKIDFVYAGAMEGGRHADAGGLDAYREGLPLLPSVGLVDAMRISPDIGPGWAEHVQASGGLVASSDPLRALDAWGLETTRRLLVPSSTEPVA